MQRLGMSSKNKNAGEYEHTVLLVEDSPSLATLYQGFLRNSGYRIVVFNLGAAALEWLEGNTPDAILLDLKLPDMDGFEILRDLKSRKLAVDVLIITAHGTVDTAVQAIHAGASDFLEKPFDAKRLQTSLENVLEKRELKKEVENLSRTFTRESYKGFIGGSLAMQAVYRVIESAAPSKASIFITGESGTGKEVCAEAIHNQSKCRKGPFIPLNCAAIPGELMESEIFGHVKGAFTGAHSAREGAASRADGGRLFLDEICEMDIELQSKLLRFIQTGTFQKIGGSKIEQVDIRIICATNREPMVEVQEGRFREDLYYRLHVIPVELPPLRDRQEDVLALAHTFLEDYANEEGKDFKGFDSEIEEWFLDYQWPGNVRELQNIVRKLIVLNPGGEIGAEQLSHAGITLTQPGLKLNKIQKPQSEKVNFSEVDKELDYIQPLWVTEKEAIKGAIDNCNGNIPKAAAMLEVSASTIYRKIQAWNKA